LEIPIPPLEEQRRIAAILDASQRLQWLHKRRINSLFGLRQSMYQQLSGLPSSELLPLSSLAKITSGYAFKAADFCQQGVHVIRMSDLSGEDVDLASSELVPAEIIAGFTDEIGVHFIGSVVHSGQGLGNLAVQAPKLVIDGRRANPCDRCQNGQVWPAP
jgi:type I restriction enzyme S subunit